MRQRLFPGLLLATTALLATTVVAGQTPQRDTSTVKQVMLTMTIPASDAVFDAASDPPKDAAAWQEVRRQAVVLAESAELLMTKPHAKDNTTWMEMARALATETQKTIKAIDARDDNAMAQVGNDLYVACDTCHDRYMAN